MIMERKLVTGAIQERMNAGEVGVFSWDHLHLVDRERLIVHSVSWVIDGDLQIMVSTQSRCVASVLVYAPRPGAQWLTCRIRFCDHVTMSRRWRILVKRTK